MLKKPQGKLIAFESGRCVGFDQQPPPQPAAGKRIFYGNQNTERSVVLMFGHWSAKVARFHRIPQGVVERHVVEAIQERRVA